MTTVFDLSLVILTVSNVFPEEERVDRALAAFNHCVQEHRTEIQDPTPLRVGSAKLGLMYSITGADPMGLRAFLPPEPPVTKEDILDASDKLEEICGTNYAWPEWMPDNI